MKLRSLKYLINVALIMGLLVLAIPVAPVYAAAPTINSISPLTGPTSGGTNLIITGTGLSGTSAVTVGGVAATNIIVADDTHVTANSPAGVFGAQDVVVTTPGGSVTRTGGFIYMSVTPASGMQDTTVKNFVIKGANFVNLRMLDPNTVDPTTISFSGTGVTTISVIFINSGVLSATLSVAALALPGPRDVTVTTSNASFTLTNGFSVIVPAAPTVVSLNPGQGIAGATYKGVVIAGTNLLNSTNLAFFTPGITFSDLTVTSASQMTATITIDASVSVGLYDVTVITMAGSFTRIGGFEVVNPQIPMITSITPAFADNTGAKQPMVITGSNFTSGSSVVFSGTGVSASDVVVADSTKITLNYTVAADAVAGYRDLTVVNSQGVSNTKVFTVYRVTLTVNSPGGAIPGSTFSVYINISSVAKLNSSQFDLEYNPSVIAVVGVEGGTGISSGVVGGSSYAMVSWAYIPGAQPGVIRVLSHNPGIGAVTGSGYLARISFHVLGIAGTSSPLKLVTVPVGDEEALELTSSDLTSIPANTVNNSSVSINSLAITSLSPPATYSGILPEAVLNKVYSTTTASASGGGQPYAWSATGLPAGLAINPATGVISGTPAQTGDFIVNVTVNSSSTSQGFLLHVYPVLGLTSGVLADATQNAVYTSIVAGSASGGKPPYVWSATGLPAGLSINAATGIISGTPTQAGDFNNINISVSDSFTPPNSMATSSPLTMHVNAALNITTAPALPSGSFNTAYSPFTITAAGGKLTYSWNASGLPPGMSINASTGILSGTPTAPGTYNNISITVKDSFSPQNSFTQTFALLINGPLQITSSLLSDGVAGSPYSFSLTAGGGASPYTWSTSTVLPAWLQLSAAGVLTSAAPLAGDITLNLTVQDSASASGSASLTLHVHALLQISTAGLPEGNAGASFSALLSASGGQPPYHWSASGLPLGLTLNSLSGAISGIPAAAGAGVLAISVTDSAGPAQTASPKTLSLNIYAILLIGTSSPLPDGGVGIAYSAPVTGTGGKPPYAWSATGLPSEFSIDPLSGVISGTFAGNISSPAVFDNITIVVVDSFVPTHNSASFTFSLTIYPQLVIQTAVLPRSGVEVGPNLPAVPGWLINVPYFGDNMSASGGKAGYAWTASGLPTGISLSATGAFSGTPSVAGSFDNITITVTDSANPMKSTSRTFSLRIYKNGDANGDGQVDVADVTYVERVILVLNPPTAGCDAGLTGTPGNGEISIGDVAIIGKLSALP